MPDKRTITPSEKEYLLSLKYEDITKSLLQKLFASHYDTVNRKTIPPKFHTYDEFKLKKGESFNTEDILTNCGLYIVNKFLYEPLKEIVGYVNIELSVDNAKTVDAKIDSALLENRITSDQYIRYLNDSTWLKMVINTEVCTSLTLKSMQELPEVQKAKAEMVKKYKNELEAGDVPTASKMEKELLNIARDAMKDDPSMELMDSGARGSFNSSYKRAQVMNGAVYNSSKGKYEIMTNSLAVGIDKNDIPALANTTVDSAYSKSISTGECGYLTKKLSAAFQSELLDKPGSDCGTKGYNVITLTKANASLYMYSYIIEGSKLVRLDSTNIDKYIDKTVKLRSKQYCINKRSCNKCVGDLFYLLEVDNIGLTVPKVSGTLLNARMKVFHDPNVKLYEINTATDFE